MVHPESLLEATRMFSNPKDAHDYLTAVRWPDGVIPCPICGSLEHWFLETQLRWKCKMCKRQFSVKVGTIFEDSPIKLDKWLIAAWLLVNCKNGVSSYEIHRDLKVTQTTAWFMLQRLRLALQEGTFERLGDSDGSEVEVDESFIGGRGRYMNAKTKKRKGLTKDPTSGKEVVMGFLERGGKVRTFHIKDTRRSSLQPRIFQNIKPGATVYTDAHNSYADLKTWYDHQFIDHEVSYVEGRIHTNSLENFWSLLKRALRGTYVSVEPFHLFRYLDEQSFRFNHRKTNDGERFRLALSTIAGRRLTYRELTGKVLASAGGIDA